MDILVPIGRILYSLVFLSSGLSHFTQRQALIGYARSKNVPAPELMVPLTGAMILVGGLSVMLGCYARHAAWLLVLFLIPTAFIMHRFWDVADPNEREGTKAHFQKDLALGGAALLITYFGSGPYSLFPH